MVRLELTDAGVLLLRDLSPVDEPGSWLSRGQSAFSDEQINIS